MQTIGYSGERTSRAPAPSLLEKASWLDKLPLTLVCGVLLGFSSAGYGVSWLAWVGLAPLILLLLGSRTRLDALLTGLLFGLAYHMVALRWFLDLAPLNWLGIPGWAGYLVAGQAWILESLHQATLFAIFAIFVNTLPMRAGFLPHYRRPFFPVLLSVPVIWVFLQWIIAPSPFFLGVPIDQLAYSQSRIPAAIQIARFGGAQMIDFLLVLCNTAIALLVVEFTNLARKLPSRIDVMSDETGAIFDAVFVAALSALCLWWGHSEILTDAAMPPYLVQKRADQKPSQPLFTPEQKANYAPAIPVAVVQGNVSVEEEQRLNGAQMLQRYLPLIQNLGASLIVLPADTLDQPRRGFEQLRLMLPQLARDQKKDFISGFREKTSSGIWNGVRIFSADKFNRDTDYSKYRLIPLAEYTPINLLSALVPNALKERLFGGDMHVRGETLTTVKSVFGRVGGSISAEIVYPDLIVSEVVRGASLLVNVSDLSCFHNSMLGQELLAAGALRAVENGRYLVVAANTGVSAVIDPHGVVTSASVPGQKGVLLDRVQFLHRKTPFTRMCLWTPLYH